MKVKSRKECQQKAIVAKHAYYQYNLANGKCATTSSCPRRIDTSNANPKWNGDKWSVYAEGISGCSGPAECRGKDEKTCKRMQKQEGKCWWSE